MADADDAGPLPATEGQRGSRELDTEQSRALLGAQHLISGLPEAVRELVTESFVQVYYDAGEAIITQGQAPDGWYVLAAGRARVLRGEGALETDLGGLGPGDSFGEAGLLNGAARDTTVRASSLATALRLEPALFAAILRRHPELGAGLAAEGRARRLGPLIASHPVFAALPREELAGLIDQLEDVEVPAGDALFEEGDPAGPLYFVVDGRLRISDRAHGDLRFLRGGDILGEVSLFTDLPRTASVHALADTHLLALGPDVFRGFIADHPAVRERVAEQIAFYERGPARHVPLDFAADMLPALEAPEPAEPAPSAALPVEPHRLLLGFLAGRRVDHVPYVPQLEESDGGAACLAMVCRAFGHNVRSAHVRDLLGASHGGASKQSIVRVAEALGLQIREEERAPERLEDLRLPALVRWPGEHWAVLDEVRGSRVHIADPARGAGWIRRKDLLSYWDGTTLVPIPTRHSPRPRMSARRALAGRLVRPHARALLARAPARPARGGAADARTGRHR